MAHRIFLYGEVGAGKSTICAALTLFFLEQKGLSITVNFDNVEGTQYLYEWVDGLRDKRFPKATEDELRIDLGLEDFQRGERLGITFYEAPGEQTERLLPTDRKYSQKSQRLHKWLIDANLILLVVSARPTDLARNRLHQFLSYLIHVKKTDAPVGLVISKWDLVQSGPEGGATSVASFSSARFAESLRLLNSRSFTGETEVFSFSIGAVQAAEFPHPAAENGGAPLNINIVDFSKGTSKIAEWILNTRRMRSE